MTKRAAIYARVSKAYKEDDDRVTIEGQMTDCEAYCAKHGYTIVARYIDKDKYRVRKKLVNPSGTRKDRPGYSAMLKAALAGEFDLIIAWKEDRLYRGSYSAMPLSEVLDENRGLNVELVMENFDHKMLGIKAAIAKIELDNIRDRMVMGKRVRIERGEVPGGMIRYGYEKGIDKRLVINPVEAEVINKIYAWYNEGQNNMEIRRRLNAMNTPCRIGKIWSKASIQNILTFEGYSTGEYTATLDGVSYTLRCDPIITRAVWEKSREVRLKNTNYRGRHVKEDYLCRGLVTCLCGWLWTAKSYTGRAHSGKNGRYICTKQAHQPEMVHPECPGAIGSKFLDNYVWNYILKICENPKVVHDAIDKKIARLQAELGDIEYEAERLQRELDKLTEERQWVINMAKIKAITQEDMELQLASMEFQALDLRRQHGDKISALVVQQQAESLKEWVDEYLINISYGLQALNTDICLFSEGDRAKLYEELEAARFEEKYKGDTSEALKWAIFEEKRRIVRMMVEKVLVVKGKNGEKQIEPKLAIDIPAEYVDLVSSVSASEYGRASKNQLFEHRLAERKNALRSQLERPTPPGVIAYLEGRIVGWCGLGVRQELERLVRSRTIPAVDDRPVWTIVCFLVLPGYRRRGVARALLRGAIECAREYGAPALEAYPVDPGGRPGGKRIDPSSAYVGTLSMFEKEGFHRVIETAARSAGLPRWLVRLELISP